MFVLALSLYNTWNRGVFLLCKITNLLIYSIEDKCIVLGEILHLFQCQSGSANLKSIGGPGNAGILLMNNNITGCNRVSIINQSVTGIFEKEIDLLTL